MQKFSQLIREHFVNLIWDKTGDKDKMRKYSKEVYDIIVKSYEYIGGLAGCKDYDDFIAQYIDDDSEQLFWKLVTRSGRVSCIKIYSKKRGGRKGTVIATDGTEQGLKDIKEILRDDYNLSDRGAWDEVSGKALGAALNQGAIPMPASVAADCLTGKNIKPKEDGFFYDRVIGGTVHTKLLIGFPPKGSGERPDTDLVLKLKELGKKYESESKHSAEEFENKFK